VLKVDTGQEERQLVAGIRLSYAKEDLNGRQIILVANLEPAVIRGHGSHGMLLAASDDEGISILSPDREVALGSAVK
jgi:methionyl-tRNA synthetase